MREANMFIRILSFVVAAASVAAAAPTRADDPSGPSPDDPGAASWVARAARPAFTSGRSARSPDDAAAHESDPVEPGSTRDETMSACRCDPTACLHRRG